MKDYKSGYINLSLVTTRNEIIKNVAENTIEYDYLYNNYEKILNKVKKIYENDEKAKYAYLQMQMQEQINQYKEQQKKEQKKIIVKTLLINIFKTICSPIGLILFFLILFIWGYFAFAVQVLNG